MTLRADLRLRSHIPFFSFLREELAPRPGRAAAAVRVATSCAIVTGIGMLYQIPLTAMMVYVVFLISQEDAAGTLVTGLVAGLAATLAVALSLVLYALDASEPALRLPLMAMSTFLGMFLARTLVVGPAAFLAAYVLVLSQTIVDEVPSVEYLTRMVLWLWVIVMVPASVTVTINLAFGQDPRALTRRTASRLLRSLADALRTDASSELRDQSIRALELTAMREHAGIFDRDLQRLSAVDSGLIDTLAEVLAIARILPPQASRPAKASLRALTEHCLAAFERREGGERAALDLSEETCSASRPVVVAMFAALQRLADGIAQRNAPGSSRPTSEHPHPVFAPDAFTSPSHLRFALKATVGAMLAYVIYSGLDWPGINTSMTTVFFVALGSLGESVHKFTLRIGGALVGGTLAALCLVYVLPWMTDVGQLCLLIAAVCAICAWIATSDERLSYAGLQIAFAFLLGTLQGYGESTSFTSSSSSASCGR
jgi:multidrug resistance protein MdtO